MKIFIMGFNLYKGGSLQIKNFLLESLLNYCHQSNTFILLVSADTLIEDDLLKRDDIVIIKIKYPLNNKYINILYRLFYEQIYPVILKIKFNYEHVVLFNNIPIFLLSGSIQSVYFHNVNYLRKISLQKIYFDIVIKLKKNSIYFVQSSVVEKELSKVFKGKIFIARHPLIKYYDNLLNVYKVSDIKIGSFEPNSFIYPAFYYPHKNHSLFKEYEKIFEKNNVTVYLTIEDADFSFLFGNSKSIKNLGILENIDVLLTLKELTGLINVSLNESFMIPIIEAMILKKPVISLKKEYSHFLLEEKGLFFDDIYSLNVLLSNVKIIDVVDYDMIHIDCCYEYFINQFLPDSI